MTYLPESPDWEKGIRQFEITDMVQGGPDGTDNIPLKQLANRTSYLKERADGLIADQVDGVGRDLFKILGVNSVQAAMDALSERCNGTGQPDFSGLMIGDYIDGIDLSTIPAENEGDAGQPFNSTYINNRIILSGFNTYRGFGDTENIGNHLLFTFRNSPIRKRMNPINDNTGGYTASEIRAFLEGLNGDGTGDMPGVTTAAFMNALIAQLGEGHLVTLRKAHSIKASQAWGNYTVFLPSELEVIGYPNRGDEGVFMPALTSPVLPARAAWNTNVQFPIFSNSGVYRIKRYNGARLTWWLQTPRADSPAGFALIGINGLASNRDASLVRGCAPAFCVA